MNELQIFQFDHTPVRVVIIDDQPWWVLADVCRVLGIKKPRDVTARLDSDEKGVAQIDTPGGMQKMTVVNEPGLYRILFRSDKPIAKRLTRWVTHDVLPTIRKYGAYSMDELQRRRENRAALKPIRRELTDAIRDCVPESPNKRWMYKNFFDLSYKTSIGSTAAQLRKQRGAPKNAVAADYLTADELVAVARRDNQISTLLDLGWGYHKIKDALLASPRPALPSQPSAQSARPST